MKIIPIEKAIGKKLEYDLTGFSNIKKIKKIFPRGYIIKKEDIEELKDMGKFELIILKKNKNKIFESDAAYFLSKKALGKFCKIKKIKEGKAIVISKENGLFSININKLNSLNLIDGIIVSSKKNYTFVKKGEVIVVFGIIPIEIDKIILEKAIKILKKSLFCVHPIIKQKIGLITTGNEIYYKRIKDMFFEYIENILKRFKENLNKQIILPDKEIDIEKNIYKMIENKFQIILLSGGMSIDANDITKKAIQNIKNIDIISYGSPVLPGAMLLVAYIKKIPIIGIPAGVILKKHTVLNIILPFLLSKRKITKKYLASLSNGGILF